MLEEGLLQKMQAVLVGLGEQEEQGQQEQQQLMHNIVDKYT